MRAPICLAIGILLSTTLVFSQKKPLDHSVYDGWKSLQSTAVSNDGKVVATLIAPQEGDTALFIQRIEGKERKSVIRVEQVPPAQLHRVDNKRPSMVASNATFYRVTRYTLSRDGQWAVGLLKAPLAERRQARIDKKKQDELPKDSLLIVDNRSFAVHKIPNVTSYKAATEMSRHVAYSLTLPKDTTRKEGKERKAVILRDLESQHEDTLNNVKEHIFNRWGNAFAVIIQPEEKDSTDIRRVEIFDLVNNTRKTISSDPKEYKSLLFDEPGEQLTYLATGDTSKVKQKEYDLHYYSAGSDTARVLANRSALGLPEGWIFNEHASPSFSKNGERILIGAAPKQPPKDTTIVDFEMAKLDIWHWRDPLVQPQQLVELRSEERRTYTGIVRPDRPNHFTAIANETMPHAAISDEGNGRYALLSSNLPYLVESTWDLSPKYDVWVMDLETNSLREVAKPLLARPMLSPRGNYLYWWDSRELAWFAYDIASRSARNLTGEIPVNFWNEKNDVPRAPGAYGVAAWGENDEYLLIYDAFDLWKVDPKGMKGADNVTNHAGRSDSITFRYVRTDPDKRFIEKGDLLLLSAFDNKSKEWGYYTLKQSGRSPLQKREMGGFTYSGLLKAKESDLLVYQKSNFSTSPNLHVTTDLWKTSTKLTDINPQMEQYNWGTAELFSWISYAGIPLEGILYKPEDFDPAKRYPVIIYFYEKHSGELYRYFTPAPSRSTVNIPFFVSRGYLVFTPDIHYTVGQPGEDAYNAIVSGAEALAKNEWVDSENMAIQGQSWGGYQVAYLITRTDMFKAAGAGAPVSNMTSAYGGIRWGSGRSRQYQYEQTQSRLGYTMSDSLEVYLRNSPVFFADKITTPLLIMHNDNDGAVPWYQGIELFMTMRRLGKPVWMLQYNNEEHNLIHRRNSKDLSIRLQQFFDHYLKGEPAPAWMTKGVPAIEKGKTWGYEY
ncbi:MAG: prolyl oligopeptidase family serine peptidase [Fermentimonas sp.]|jgi:dipeptidyl aminopeptidase/acylaminoacyl peptidase